MLFHDTCCGEGKRGSQETSRNVARTETVALEKIGKLACSESWISVRQGKMLQTDVTGRTS